MKADMINQDDREDVFAMEPTQISSESRHRAALTDLTIELAQKSAGFRRSLPEGLLGALADLVRAMNCYYSNLIEGHGTHPIDIERALKGDYSQDRRKRDLQIEATAHIAVQHWIDTGGLKSPATTTDSLLEIHRRFCGQLPGDLLWVEDPVTRERIAVIPGEFRRRDVVVGRHIPISAPAIPRFIKRYEEVYSRLGKTDTIIATAAAHHRLAWIHPFLDGNGRVARLVSHATLTQALDTGALWSIARGLARNVSEYKGHLAACDLRRRNDLDGGGNLSEENLAEFTRFFLSVCLDQVKFMEDLMQPEQLRARVLTWAQEEIQLNKLPPRAGNVLQALLHRGDLPRSAVADVVGAGDRHARRVVSALVDHGVITSPSTRSPLRLAFPAALAARWLPGLFPDRTD